MNTATTATTSTPESINKQLQSCLQDFVDPAWLAMRAAQIIPAASQLNALNEALTVLSLWAQPKALLLPAQTAEIIASRNKEIYRNNDEGDLGPLLRAYRLLVESEDEGQLDACAQSAGLHIGCFIGAKRLRRQLVSACRQFPELRFNQQKAHLENLTEALLPSMQSRLVVLVDGNWQMLLSEVPARLAAESRCHLPHNNHQLLLALNDKPVSNSQVNLILAATPVSGHLLSKVFPQQVTTKTYTRRYDYERNLVLGEQYTDFRHEDRTSIEVERKEVVLPPEGLAARECIAKTIVEGKPVKGAEPVMSAIGEVSEALARAGQPLDEGTLDQLRRVIAAQLEHGPDYQRIARSVGNLLQALSGQVAASKRDYPDTITIDGSEVKVSYTRQDNLQTVTLHLGDKLNVLENIQDKHLPGDWKKCCKQVEVNLPLEGNLRVTEIIPFSHGCTVLRACALARQKLRHLDEVLSNPDCPLVTEHTVWDPPAQPGSTLKVGTSIWLVAGDDQPYFTRQLAVSYAHQLLGRRLQAEVIPMQVLRQKDKVDTADKTGATTQATTDAADKPGATTQATTEAEPEPSSTPRTRPIQLHPQLLKQVSQQVLKELPLDDMSVRQSEIILQRLLQPDSDLMREYRQRLDQELPVQRAALAGYQGDSQSRDRHRLLRRQCEREYQNGNILMAASLLEEVLAIAAYVQKTQKKAHNPDGNKKMSRDEFLKRSQNKPKEKEGEQKGKSGKKDKNKDKGGKKKGK